MLGTQGDVGDVVTWWDMWDMETLGVMEGTRVGMIWRGIGDMEEGCGRHQNMGSYEDILVCGHHPGETLRTC